MGTAAGMPVGLSGGRSAGNSWVWVCPRRGKTWVLLCNLGYLGNFAIGGITGKDVALSVLRYIVLECTMDEILSALEFSYAFQKVCVCV